MARGVGWGMRDNNNTRRRIYIYILLCQERELSQTGWRGQKKGEELDGVLEYGSIVSYTYIINSN